MTPNPLQTGRALATLITQPARGAALVVALSALVGCAAKEPILPGDRYDLRDLDGAAEQLASDQARAEEALEIRPDTKSITPPYSVDGEAVRISLGTARNVTSWPQRYLSAERLVPHLQLANRPLTQVWSTQFGAGNDKRQRITSAPVAAGGRVFVLDALQNVTAIGTNGATLWQKDLTPATETSGEVVGGGLAVVDGRIYATTGFGRLHVLDAATGAEIWSKRFDAALTAAPLVDGGLIYVISRDGFAYALDRKSGRIVWEVEGTPASTSVLGSGAPAIAGKTAIFPFPSGELAAVLKLGGVSLWDSSVSGSRLGRSYGSVNAIVGGPVVSGRTVYVATAAGRLAAIDSASGDREWTALEGAVGPVISAGGSLFVVSDEAKLLRLNASDGTRIWAATLPLYATEKIARREEIYVHFGPILAGGRLILASTDGVMREIDPASGRILRATDLGSPAASEPIIVGGTLYVITANGVLHAFR